ncbi:MAG: hypothetical protein HW397_518 [Dehalococcoidia bacterium]|nr:hypothetical protein [Dehalococcoidia bacterium]
MDHADLEIIHALENTHVRRPPRQRLSSFGDTTVRYYLVSEPAYVLESHAESETVVREGTVTAQRPAIVTPAYMLHLEGFGAEAKRSLEYLGRLYGPGCPGLMYTYKNEVLDPSIVKGKVEAVAGRIAKDLDRNGKDLAAVIVGVDNLWDVSLLKFIYELTASAFQSNVAELQQHGLLRPDPVAGIPQGALQTIETLFRSVEFGGTNPAELKMELDRWDLFPRYEDRFLSLFRGKRR